jgi:hypothetical protein
MLHQKLKKSCIPQTITACLRKEEEGCRSTRYREIPMSTYKTVQAGPNKALGGVKNGLLSDGYHSRTFRAVTSPATAPTISGKTKLTSNSCHFFFIAECRKLKRIALLRSFNLRSRPDLNWCRSFCRALPSRSATGPFVFPHLSRRQRHQPYGVCKSRIFVGYLTTTIHPFLCNVSRNRN